MVGSTLTRAAVSGVGSTSGAPPGLLVSPGGRLVVWWQPLQLPLPATFSFPDDGEQFVWTAVSMLHKRQKQSEGARRLRLGLLGLCSLCTCPLYPDSMTWNTFGSDQCSSRADACVYGGGRSQKRGSGGRAGEVHHFIEGGGGGLLP